MNVTTFIQQLNDKPESIQFSDTMAVIEEHYLFTPTAFRNGNENNAADQNNGSCKIFAFGQLQQLTEQQTLHCFGDYYRQDVLAHPEKTDHQNIRNFMQSGWQGIQFQGQALTAK